MSKSRKQIDAEQMALGFDNPGSTSAADSATSPVISPATSPVTTSPAQTSFFFSNSLMDLAKRLHASLSESAPADIMVPRIVLVPNRNVSRWLQMRIADFESERLSAKGSIASGVCANVKFLYLESGIIGLLKQLDPIKTPVRIPDRLDVTIEIIKSLVKDQDAKKSEFPELKRYSTSGEYSPRKVFHLASRLAAHFQEYEYHRQDWIHSWRTSGKIPEMNPQLLPLYSEQASLFTRVHKQLRESALDARVLTLSEYGAAVSGSTSSSQANAFFVFGISQLSDLHLDLLLSISRRIPMNYFSLEYQKDSFPAWIRVQKHQIEIIKEKTEHSSWSNSVVTPEGRTVLGRLQRKLSGIVDETVCPQDTSIQVLGCPGPYREVETVYHQILTLLKSDSELKLTDIAVLVPDMAKYHPILASVFEGMLNLSGRPVLPYNLTDFSASGTSVYASGLRALADLIEGNFTRRELFALFSNPCFQSAHNVSEETVSDWLKWVGNVNAFRQYNDSVTSFSGALRRLRLGILFDREQEEFAGIALARERFVDNGDLGTLTLVIADLFESIHALAENPGSVLLKEIIGRHLKLSESNDLESERAVEYEFLSALKRLDDVKFELPLLCEFIRAIPSGLPGSKGEYLAGGITISALQPMRPVPFKIIYVLGMEEGSFPGRADESRLNLRNLETRKGDASLPDVNRLLFLEALASATDKFIVTYVSRDTRKDSRIGPCSLVHELMEQTGIPDFKQLQIPLSLSSPAYPKFETDSGPWDVPLNFNRPDRLISLLPFLEGPTAQKQKSALTKGYKKDRENLTQVLRQSESIPVPDRVSLWHLRQYLRDPVSAVLEHRFRFSSRGENPALEEHESFYPESKLYYDIPREVLHEIVKLPPESRAHHVEEIIDIQCRQHEKRGQLVGGYFGAGYRLNIKQQLEPALAYLNTIQKHFTYLTLGNDAGIPLKTKSHNVVLEGNLGLFSEIKDGVADLVVPIASQTFSPGHIRRHIVFPYLSYLGLLAERGQQFSVLVHLVSYHEKGARLSLPMKVSVADALKYLGNLADDFIRCEIGHVTEEFMMKLNDGFLPWSVPAKEFQERVEEYAIDPGEDDLYYIPQMHDLVTPVITNDLARIATARWKQIFEFAVKGK